LEEHVEVQTFSAPSLHRLNPSIFQPHNQRFNGLGVSIFLVYTEGLILGVR
jgi:hypothetical protein